MDKELETKIVEGSETPDVDAEKKSVAATDKAADATKDAKKRKGDKDADEKSDLKNDAKDLGADPKKGADVKKATVGEDYKTELDDLVESEATLSEDFKTKTAVIFEAALKSKLSEEIDRMEESYAEQLAEEVTSYKSEMVEKVDSYLSYVAEQWMTENKLAVTNGLRAEIAENFMSKLKDVFTESYITVPAEKEDLVDGLVEHTEELEAKLNESVKKEIAIAEELKGLKRAMIIRESSKDLAETQAEKLNGLVEDIEFTNEEDFASKVKTVKESFFKEAAVKKVDDVEEELTEEVEVSSAMEAYLKALKK